MINEVLYGRLKSLERFSDAFKYLYPVPPSMIRRGEVQDSILDALKLNKQNCYHRRKINDSMRLFGYRLITLHGRNYYKV